MERNGTRKANFGMGSSSSDDFLLQSVGNIKILPGSGKNINVSGYRITNAGTPTASSDVATKQYVDNAVAAGGGGGSGGGSGGTTPDLSNYVTTTQLNTALTNYVSNSNLTTQLANYLTTTNANNNYVSKTQPITLGASRNKPVQISGATKNPVFIEFVRNNSNMGYFGLGSGSNNNVNIGARSGNLSLEVGSGNSVVVNNATIQGVSDPVNATDAANKQYVDNAIANVPQQTTKYWYKFTVSLNLGTVTATPTSPFTQKINLNTIQSQLSDPTYNTIKNMKFVSATSYGVAYTRGGDNYLSFTTPSNFYIQGSSAGGIPKTFANLNIGVVINNLAQSTNVRYLLCMVGISDTQISDSSLEPISLATTRSRNTLTADNETNDIELTSIELI